MILKSSCFVKLAAGVKQNAKLQFIKCILYCFFIFTVVVLCINEKFYFSIDYEVIKYVPINSAFMFFNRGNPLSSIVCSQGMQS